MIVCVISGHCLSRRHQDLLTLQPHAPTSGERHVYLSKFNTTSSCSHPSGHVNYYCEYTLWKVAFAVCTEPLNKCLGSGSVQGCINVY